MIKKYRLAFVIMSAKWEYLGYGVFGGAVGAGIGAALGSSTDTQVNDRVKSDAAKGIITTPESVTFSVVKMMNLDNHTEAFAVIGAVLGVCAGLMGNYVYRRSSGY